jgi:ankyrin repeat protein
VSHITVISFSNKRIPYIMLRPGKNSSRKCLVLTLILSTVLLSACTDNSGKTPLMKAAAAGNLLQTQLLIQQRANISVRDKMDLDALSYAIMAERPVVVRYLLAHGANANSANADGTTVLMIAARVGDTDVVKMLHDHGAIVSQANHDGVTPLMAAAGGDNHDTLVLLLSYGADPCSKDKNQRTARQIAELWWGAHETAVAINKDKRLAGINCVKETHE